MTRRALLRAHVRSLFPPPLAPDLLEAVLPAARARAASAAILLFVLGFVLDDLHVLRVPGFLAGVLLALACLAFGSTILSRAYARRLVARPHAEAVEVARRWTSRHRLGIVGACLVAGTWLVLSAGGSSWLA